jgi:SAM-dependent methyltransferase
VGIPLETFEAGGQEQLAYLLRAGLTPESKVVDLGCGVLRAGYPLIHFLAPGKYCGIEPHQERLAIGRDRILEPETLARKHPRFDTNARFDTSVFGEKFDFMLAYSIWTHASKTAIASILDSFLRDAEETGVLLATYLPASWRHPDYQGEQWFGTSHESDVPGCIYHRYDWIVAECGKRGLKVVKLPQDETHGLFWLAIGREPTLTARDRRGKRRVSLRRMWRYLVARWL